MVQKTELRLYRAYLLKEGLRLIFQMVLDERPRPWPDGWPVPSRCRIPAFVKLQQRIVKHKDRILASIQHVLSHKSL